MEEYEYTDEETDCGTDCGMGFLGVSADWPEPNYLN